MNRDADLRSLVWALVLVALALGCVGFARHFAAVGEQKSFLDVFHLTLQLFDRGAGNQRRAVRSRLDHGRIGVSGGQYTGAR